MYLLSRYLLIVVFLITFVKLFNLFWFFTYFGSFALILSISWLLTKYLSDLLPKVLVDTSGKVVLITGCDTGFGYLTAETLHQKGVNVLATCLNINSSGAQTLIRMGIRTLEMDVTNEQQIVKTKINVQNYLSETNSQLWALVNNAGIATGGQTDWGTIDDLKRVLDVNVIGLTQVTRHFIPLIYKRGTGGRVVNIGSCAGRLTAPGLGFYSMSKHAVISFSDALRREMSVWNVKVITIEPEFYRTPMCEKERVICLLEDLWERTDTEIKSDYGTNYFNTFKKKVDLVLGTHRANPLEVVDTIIDAITNVSPKSRYTCCGPMFAIFWWILEIFPNEINDKIFALATLFSVKPRALDKN